jgi:adenosylhomocysteine nucleosidase
MNSTRNLAFVAALEREVSPLIRDWTRVHRHHEGRDFIFFEHDDKVAVCAGIGMHPARRATEALIAIYHPAVIHSVGFAGALDQQLKVGDLFLPSLIIDTRDGSRFQIAGGDGILLSFMSVAGAEQKMKLAQAYSARAVDMEAAAVAASAATHGINFAAIKVISDEADFEMPGMSDCIDSNGQFHTSKFVLFALLRPWLWRRLLLLARNSSRASRVLNGYLGTLCHEGAPLLSGRPSALPTGGGK